MPKQLLTVNDFIVDFQYYRPHFKLFKMKNLGVIVLLSLMNNIVRGQAKWPIPLYLPNYGVYINLTNDVNINDTSRIEFSEKIYFKVVLFDSRGKMYFEAYKKNKLYEKGYYENSLDTLRRYSKAISLNRRNGKIINSTYFHPLKNGLWIETIKGKFVSRKYSMGVEVLE